MPLDRSKPARGAACALALAVLTVLAVSACDATRTDPPETGPTPAESAPGPEFVFPLADVEAGEFLTIAGTRIETEYRVKSVTPTHVEVSIRRLENGVPLEDGDEVLTWDRNLWGLPDEGVLRSLVPTLLDVRGRSLAVWRGELQGGVSRRAVTFHPAFPVHGMIQTAQVNKGREEREQEFVVIRDSGNTFESAPVVRLPPESVRFVPPLSTAEQGETLVLAGRGLQVKYTIVATDKLTVDVEVTKRTSDLAPWGKPERRTWHRNGLGLDGGWVAQSLRRETLRSNGEPFATWRLVAAKDGERRALWLTDALNVHGVVRVAPLGDDGEPDLRRALTVPGVQ